MFSPYFCIFVLSRENNVSEGFGQIILFTDNLIIAAFAGWLYYELDQFYYPKTKTETGNKL